MQQHQLVCALYKVGQYCSSKFKDSDLFYIGKTATVGRKTIHYNKSIIGSIIITSDHKIPVGLIKNYILFAGIIVLFCCGISLSMQDSSSDSDERICIRHISYMLALTTSSSSPSTTLS